MWGAGEAEIAAWAYRGVAEFGVTVMVLVVVLGAFLWGLYLIGTRVLPAHLADLERIRAERDRRHEEELAQARSEFLAALSLERARCADERVQFLAALDRQRAEFRQERENDRAATAAVLDRFETWLRERDGES